MLLFRQADKDDIDQCWAVVDRARNNMIAIGRHQWTTEYPNRQIIADDICNGGAYIVVENNEIRTYGAVYKNGEPQYEHLDGNWLSLGDYFVIHRLAVDPAHERQGFARFFFDEVMKLMLKQDVTSLKVDTNYDNVGMLHLMDVLDFTYCGEVVYKTGLRKAFEKLLTN